MTSVSLKATRAPVQLRDVGGCDRDACRGARRTSCCLLRCRRHGSLGRVDSLRTFDGSVFAADATTAAALLVREAAPTAGPRPEKRLTCSRAAGAFSDRVCWSRSGRAAAPEIRVGAHPLRFTETIRACSFPVMAPDPNRAAMAAVARSVAFASVAGPLSSSSRRMGVP